MGQVNVKRDAEKWREGMSEKRIEWTNEKRKLSELIPWPRNPRQIKTDQAKRLRQSFEQFGQVETIAIGPGAEVYNGHQRLNVLMAQHGGDYEVEVRVASRALTEKEREKLTVYLHKGAAGEWDFDTLSEWDIEDLLDWGFNEWDLDLAGIVEKVDAWEPEEKFDGSDDDGIVTEAGYRLSSIWYGMTKNNEVRKYMLDLPQKKGVHDGATVKLNYSRTNAEETERIVKTYMRPGDYFFEMCCGWMTFSSTAKYFGFSGKGGDIWDVSLEFCNRQIKAMPGEGVVEVIYADCTDTKEPADHYDFVHSNPPFFSLEPYGDSDKDLASTGSYERWLDAMGLMGAEAERILKPGGLANFVINDFREDGKVVPMHADFINAILRKSTLVLHDLVVAEVISQALRFRKHDFERRRTVKCHEYVITFKKPDS